MKHLISLFDLTHDDFVEILDLATQLKREWQEGDRTPLLQGRVLTQVFEKPSLRTRNSFEAAMAHLGGHGIFLSAKDAGLEGRESLADVARVLSGYSDAIVLRTFSQKLIDQFAQVSSCPIINGLSDERHPCQALTDVLTIRESFGELKGQRLVFIGDGNNVAKSLAIAAGLMGLSLTVVSPSGYELTQSFLADVKQRIPDADVRQETDPVLAVQDADVVYTDVWASMGHEAEAEERNQVFAPYQVNVELMSRASSECRFMHDLPARRGFEVTDDVMDGPQSIVFRQAENRMHLAKGLLVWLIGEN